MSSLGSIRGAGILTVSGHDPVPATYEIRVHASPGGLKDIIGRMDADAAVLFASIGNDATLQLETGERLEIVFSNVTENQGTFHSNTRIPGF